MPMLKANPLTAVITRISAAVRDWMKVRICAFSRSMPFLQHR